MISACSSEGLGSAEPGIACPPSELLTPLYVSFHLNEAIRSGMLTRRGIEHLTARQPIGCRDPATVEIELEEPLSFFLSVLSMDQTHMVPTRSIRSSVRTTGR